MFGSEFDVRTATTLAEARRVLTGCSVEIVISDQRMPEIEGTVFLREVARTCPETFRVLLTGEISVGEVMPEVGTGVIHLFLPKPWTQSEMRAAFERAHAYLSAPPEGFRS